MTDVFVIIHIAYFHFQGFLYLSTFAPKKKRVLNAAKKLQDVRRQFHAVILRSGSISCIFQQARWHTRDASWQLVGQVPWVSFVHCVR